jgi:general secretion pathway protein M
VSIRERLERLEDRERRLLGIAVAVAVAGALLVPPVALAAVVHGKRGEVEDIQAAVQSILAEEESIAQSRAERAAITERYSRPAPQLQAFLARLASEASVEIPESQDRQVVPRGKRFDERSTKITLRKVGMLKLSRFLEKIVNSGHPVRITQIDIRKRGTEPDSYDVDMIVSAFDRKAPEKSAAAARDGGVAPGASAATAEGDEEKE